MPTSYYEDDASVGDFVDQNIMDEDDYESNESMNEMLNFVRGETIVDQMAPPGNFNFIFKNCL